MKRKIILAFGLFLVFGVLNVYSQSNRLIGTWVSGGEGENHYPTVLTITKDKISILGSGYGSETRSMSWSDNNDGMTLTVDGRFVIYMVSDSTLLIGLPSRYGSELDYRYLTKYVVTPVSNIYGKWIMPAETGDLEVTISNTQITMKRGRQTKTLSCRFNDNRPNTISIDVPAYGAVSFLYFFMDESHLVIMLPQNDSDPGGYSHLLIKQ